MDDVRTVRLGFALRLVAALALTVGLMAGFLVNAAQAATTITVTNTNNDGPGSLRQAINDVEGAGTITFASHLAGQTIKLASTLTMQFKSVNIDASALSAPVTISGNDTVQVMSVGYGVGVNLRGLRITGGRAGGGGAIYNEGIMQIRDCIITGNTAGAGGGIYAWGDFGDVELVNSEVSGNTATAGAGGGLYVAGWSRFVVTDSNLSGNSSATYGGAIFRQGFPGLIVTGSTFSNNSSAVMGGAIFAGEYSAVSLTNSTFSGNSTGQEGGAILARAGFVAMNSTFSDNATQSAGKGGGLAVLNTGALTLTNTIIANSLGGDCYLETPFQFPVIATSLVEDGSCLSTFNGDPKLGPLADNGGPTKTHALLLGSPAIDKGTDTGAPATDQRGVARPQGAAYDIGAFEFRSTPPTGQTDPASVVTATGATLNGTVNANGLETTITFEYGPTAAYGQSVTATQSPVTGLADTPVSYVLGGLTSNTTYHYRVVAENSAGIAYGEDLTFTTGQYCVYLPLAVR